VSEIQGESELEIALLQKKRRTWHCFKVILNLKHFSRDIVKFNYRCDCETILEALSENKIDIYEFFDGYVGFILATKPDITPKTLSIYLVVIRSYFAFHDIDVIPSKFKRRVKIPRLYREDEEPIDAADIRKILLNCNNRRLKSYMLILASSGARATEAASIRLKDIDFSTTPTRIHLRPEFTKTRTARDIYISNEATKS
jgi:integrase